jgi:Ca2+-transporting ATPase
MNREPRGQEDPIIDKRILASVAFTGPLAAAILLPSFFMYIGAESILLPQTVLFTALALFEIVMIQMVRDSYDLQVLDNKYLVGGVMAAFLAQLVVLYSPVNKAFGTVPLTLEQFGISAGLVAVFTVIGLGFYKLLDRKFGKRSNTA